MPRAERETVRVSRVRKKQVIWPVLQESERQLNVCWEGGVDSLTHTHTTIVTIFQTVKMRVDCLEREISYYLGHYQLYNRDYESTFTSRISPLSFFVGF
jgi:hypothetical protein